MKSLSFSMILFVVSLQAAFCGSAYAANKIFMLPGDSICILADDNEWDCKNVNPLQGGRVWIEGIAKFFPMSFRFSNDPGQGYTNSQVENYFLDYAKKTTSIISNLEVQQMGGDIKETDFISVGKCAYFNNTSSGYLVVYFLRHHALFITICGDILDEGMRNQLCRKATSLIAPLLKTKSAQMFIANENNELQYVNDDFTISDFP